VEIQRRIAVLRSGRKDGRAEGWLQSPTRCLVAARCRRHGNGLGFSLLASAECDGDKRYPLQPRQPPSLVVRPLTLQHEASDQKRIVGRTHQVGFAAIGSSLQADAAPDITEKTSLFLLAEFTCPLDRHCRSSWCGCLPSSRSSIAAARHGEQARTRFVHWLFGRSNPSACRCRHPEGA